MEENKMSQSFKLLDDYVKQLVIKQAALTPMSPSELVDYHRKLFTGLAAFSNEVIELLSPINKGNVQEQFSGPVATSKQTDNLATIPSTPQKQVTPAQNKNKEIPRELKAGMNLLLKTDIVLPEEVQALPVEKTLGARSLYFNSESILCLECGKWHKIITKAHLKKHGMTVEEYKNKWNIPKNMHLSARDLIVEKRVSFLENNVRERRNIKTTDPVIPTTEISSQNEQGKRRIKVDSQVQEKNIPVAQRLYSTPERDANIETLRNAKITLPPEFDNLEGDDLLGIKSLLFDKDQIVCLECGQWKKVLTKPHLKHHGLTSLEYKAKWKIPQKLLLTAQTLRDKKSVFFTENKVWEKRAVLLKNKASGGDNEPQGEGIS